MFWSLRSSGVVSLKAVKYGPLSVDAQLQGRPTLCSDVQRYCSHSTGLVEGRTLRVICVGCTTHVQGVPCAADKHCCETRARYTLLSWGKLRLLSIVQVLASQYVAREQESAAACAGTFWVGWKEGKRTRRISSWGRSTGPRAKSG